MQRSCIGITGYVAPFAGAWIEIKESSIYAGSAPVAPFAGAWIEIDVSNAAYAGNAVAPFAGAWIEIFRASHTAPISTSLPSRERGLK